MNETKYDIIGDVHGMSDALKRLLVKLGYSRNHDNQSYSHPDNRKVIFVGGLIDRGHMVLRFVL